MPKGPSKEEARQIENDVNKATDENATDLKGAMGSGCSPELTKQVTGTLTAVVSVVDKVNRVLSTPGVECLEMIVYKKYMKIRRRQMIMLY